MIDWTKSMQQTFDFYIVDPVSWRNVDKLTTVTDCTITIDSNSALISNASLTCQETVGECYIRVYLRCVQNGEQDSFPLGTFLVQTPSSDYNGRTTKNSLQAYSPLIELQDTKPPNGYSIMKGSNIMEYAYDLTRENARAPVVKPTSATTIPSNFVSDFMNDTWLSYIKDLIGNDKYSFSVDEMGRILFDPVKKMATLQPVWTYTDDNSSIIKPEIQFEQDLYGVPNVVEVLYSDESTIKFASSENDDINSPVSIANRGRKVVYRTSNPNSLVNPTQEQLQDYADSLLESLSSFEYTVTYKHGYVPSVHVGDCVMLNYRRAGLNNVRAKVVSQNIDCRAGCEVTEKAVYTKRFWEVRA